MVEEAFVLPNLSVSSICHEKRKLFTDPNTKASREKVISSTLKNHQEQNNLFLIKYISAFAVPDFERLKPKLKHIFGIKIEHVSTRKPRFPWRLLQIIFQTHSFKEILSMTDCHKNWNQANIGLAKPPSATI